MSKYKFKITYRNENEYGQYWGDNRYTVSIIAETLEQAKQKLDEIEENGYRMHKNILKWEAEEIAEEKDKEIERLNNIINDIDTYIHLWKLDDIGEKTMLILNDILLIKNGMRNEVVRLGSDKE